MFIALLCLLFASQLSGQEPLFRHYSVDDGLPSSEVYRVFQDEKGYIWLATDQGVAVFDGYRFTRYTIRDGLTDNTVLYFYDDPFDRRWCITLNNDLCYFENGKIKEYAYNDNIKEYFNSAIIVDFVVDDDGTVYCGSQKQGMCVILSDGRIKHVNLESPTRNNAVKVGDEVINYGIKMNIDRYNPDVSVEPTWSFTTGDSTYHINIPYQKTRSALNPAIHPLDSGEYIGYWSQFFVSIDNAMKINWVELPDIVLYASHYADEVWVGTYLNGVFRIKEENGRYRRAEHFLDGLSVTSILHDRNGGMWVSTLEQGVFYASAPNVKEYNFTNGMSGHSAASIVGNDTVVFVGLENGQVGQIKDKGGASTFLSEIEQQVSALLLKDSILYVDFYGLLEYNIATEEFRYRDSRGTRGGMKALTFYIDSRGDLWTGNSEGFYCWRQNEGTPIDSRDKFPLHRIYDIIELKDGRFVLGSLSGALVFDGEHIEPFGDHQALRTRINTIEHFDDGLIFGTNGEGLIRTVNGSSQTIEPVEPLPSYSISSIAIDSNGLWIGTTKGISWVYKQENKWHQRSFNQAHGLGSEEVNDLLVLGNELWVATEEGVSMFKKNLLLREAEPLQTLIESLVVNRTDTTLSQTEFSYDANSIRFNFLGFNYSNEKETEYRYRLVGLDTSWVHTQTIWADYRSLPPGDYVFEVQTKNRDGRWGPTSTYAFVIMRPFWQTWWFRSIIGLLIVALIYLFFRIRVLTYNRDIVREILQSVAARFSGEDDRYVTVKSVTDGKHVRLKPQDILWVEASRNYCDVHTAQKKVTVRMSMMEIKEKLEAYPFIKRVHRSYFANLQAADTISLQEIEVNGTTIPVGRTYRKEVKSFRERTS